MMTDILNSLIVDFSKISDDKVLDSIIDHQLYEDLNFIFLGKRNYNTIWKLQKEIHEMVFKDELSNIILFLEHNHVYTFGKNANTNFLLSSYPKDAEIVNSDRGGQVTYHGPGQLIGYPIINLNQYKKSISWYMRTLENTIISTLDSYNIFSSRKDKLIGVWVEDEKICAMGVRLSKWITMHGFALNINPDMKYYDGIIPCGISHYGITSMNRILKEECNFKEVMQSVSENLKIKLNEEI